MSLSETQQTNTNILENFANIKVIMQKLINEEDHTDQTKKNQDKLFSLYIQRMTTGKVKRE